MSDLFSIVTNKLDESFNIQETRNYGLSLIFGDTAFSYAILDFKRNKYLCIQQIKKNDLSVSHGAQPVKPSFEDFLKSVFNAMPWLKNQYKSIRIAYEGKKSTLIPSPLFDVKEREHYLNFGYSFNQEETIFSDALTPLDIQHVYSVPPLVLNSLKTHYPSAGLVHFSSVLIESIWINYKNKINTNRVFLHIRDKMVDLMVFDGRQMSYFNSFAYQNRDDIVYYLIFVMEQLNHNPETIPLVLMGNIEKNSPLYELIFKYVRHVEFARRNDMFKYSHILNQIPSHFYFPLLNFQACGL